MQLPREAAAFIQSGRRITICEPLEGALRMFVGEQEISWSPILNAPLPKSKRVRPIASNQGQKPAAKHPWKRPFKAAKPTDPPLPQPPEAKKMARSNSAR